MKKLNLFILLIVLIGCDDNTEPETNITEPIYTCNLKYNDNCEAVTNKTKSFNWDSTSFFTFYTNCDTILMKDKFYKIEAFSYFDIIWRRSLEIHLPETKFILNQKINFGKGWCDTYVFYSVLYKIPNGWSGGDTYTHFIESDSSNQKYDSGSIFITEYSKDSLEVSIDSLNVYLMNYYPLSYSTSCRLSINSKFRIKKIK